MRNEQLIVKETELVQAVDYLDAMVWIDPKAVSPYLLPPSVYCEKTPSLFPIQKTAMALLGQAEWMITWKPTLRIESFATALARDPRIPFLPPHQLDPEVLRIDPQIGRKQNIPDTIVTQYLREFASIPGEDLIQFEQQALAKYSQSLWLLKDNPRLRNNARTDLIGAYTAIQMTDSCNAINQILADLRKTNRFLFENLLPRIGNGKALLGRRVQIDQDYLEASKQALSALLSEMMIKINLD